MQQLHKEKESRVEGSPKNLVLFVKKYQLNRHTLTSVNQDGYPQQSVNHVEYSSPVCMHAETCDNHVTVM